MGETETLQQRAAEAVGRVTRTLGDIPYMSSRQANFLAGLFAEHNIRQCLELGTYQGKGAAFMGAIVDALGSGWVTTIDRQSILAERSPNVHEVLKLAGVSNVTVHLEERSLTWRLMQMLDGPSPPQFDFCYFDGGHNWDVTGFAFLLVDRLLKPGAWVAFDDLDWTYERKIKASAYIPYWLAEIPPEERSVPQVRKVWELLVQRHPGYTDFKEENGWGLARKSG
jgi:predicted O-methyltransferase YrrM